MFVREVPCTVVFLVVKSDFVVCRLEYTVCNCDHLWNHHGYWWNSVGNMFLHGKVRIAFNTNSVFHMGLTVHDMVVISNLTIEHLGGQLLPCYFQS